MQIGSNRTSISQVVDRGLLIRNCESIPALCVKLTEELELAVSLFNSQTPKAHIMVMVKDVVERYRFDPVEVIVNAIARIRMGEIKIYGRVTPDVLNGAIQEELIMLSEAREMRHEQLKGHGGQEVRFDGGTMTARQGFEKLVGERKAERKFKQNIEKK